MTLRLELETYMPYVRLRTTMPVLPDGSSRFGRVVNRDAPLSDVNAGDVVENLVTRDQHVVISVAVLNWYDD
ncbi:MAG TPA: hypothetical protein VHC22_19125 [Pirellulales bacterium]|nr:hypothetical protein [Pirellulales bacterium]